MFKISGKIASRYSFSASLGSSPLHSRNLLTVSFGSSSYQCCPLTRQMSFSNNRAPTVNGATRPMGSNTLDTRFKTKRCVKDLATVLEVPRLTTRVSLLWSHFNPSTCEDSYLNEANTFGSVDWGDPSIRSARFGTLLTNLVSLNPPRRKRCTNSFDLLRALSGDSNESK